MSDHDTPNSTPAGLTGATCRSRVVVWVVLSFLTLMIVWQRWYTFDQPLDCNSAAWAVIAHEVLNGRALYTDIYDQSPPGIFAAYGIAEALVGYGHQSIFLLNITTGILTLVAVFVAVRSLGASTAGALWASTFWAVILNDCQVDASHPMREAFINLFAIWAFALLVRVPFEKKLSLGLIGAGLLFGLATLFKQVAIGIPLMLGLAHIFSAPTGEGRHKAVWRVLILGVMGAAVWGTVSLYFAFQGRFADFWRAGFVDLGQVQGNPTGYFLQQFLPTQMFHDTVLFTAPLFCLSALGVALGFGQRLRRPAVMILGLFAGAAVANALNSGYSHYRYQLWLPVASIGAGWAVSLISSYCPSRTPAIVAAGAVMFFLLRHELPYYQLPPDEWTKREGYGHGQIQVMGRDLAREINRFLLPDEGFFQLASEPGLYYYTKRRCPLKFVALNYAFIPGMTQSASYAQRIVTDVLRAEPELLVITTWSVPDQIKKEPFSSILPLYRPFPGNPQRGPFILMYRKGGNLEKRFQAASPPVVPQ